MKFILEYARRPDDDNGGNGVCSFIANGREKERRRYTQVEKGTPLHHHPYPYHRLLFADAAAVG